MLRREYRNRSKASLAQNGKMKARLSNSGLPSEPPYHLDAPEREIWDEMRREYNNFTGCGDIVLCMALQSLGRARKCSELIEEQGAMIAGRRNILKPHPLLGVERASRALCASLFEKMKIKLREGHELNGSFL